MWGHIYARLATSFGWTWEYIDEFMTLPRLKEMVAFWEDCPPLDVTFSSLLERFGVMRSVPQITSQNANRPTSELTPSDLSELGAVGITAAPLSAEFKAMMADAEAQLEAHAHGR